MRWKSISTNPEDPQVVKARQRKLLTTRQIPISHIHDYISAICKDKSVIDFGYANHSDETAHFSGQSTHKTVLSTATTVIGIDIVTPSEDLKRTSGSKASYLTIDLTTTETLNSDYQELFSSTDIFLASNVLEHLDNPGSFFRSVDKYCPAARLVVIVPNPLWILGLRDMVRINPNYSSLTVDHVAMLYPSALIELGERFNYSCLSWRYLGRGDMPKRIAFNPRGDITRPIWFFLYVLSRMFKTPFCHNQLAMEFELIKE